MTDLALKIAAEKYPQHVLEPFDEMIDIIGGEATLKLLNYFQGQHLYIPNRGHVFRDCIVLHVKDEFNGGNHRKLAMQYGISERHLRRLLAK